MYFVFIFVAVFCYTILFVKGDFVNVESVTGKAGKGLTVKYEGSLDIAKLLGLYMDDYPANANSDTVLRTSVDTGMTQIEEIAMTTHKVKDSKIVHEFTLHVYKQAMKVFENIKQKINAKEGKAQVTALAKSYQQKFTDFVQRTREYDVRTGLGDQKVVLNTIDTSVLILQRLINFLKSDSAGVGAVNEDSKQENTNTGAGISDEVLQKEVDAEKELEYHHVCVKYNFCRSAFGLKHVLQNVLKRLATVPDGKLTQAVDAITEVLKTADIKRIIDSRSETTFKDKLDRFEKTSAEHARLGKFSCFRSPIGPWLDLSNADENTIIEYHRTGLMMETVATGTPQWLTVYPLSLDSLDWSFDTINILLDALTNLNAPIEVAPENSAIAKKTTAFYNIVNELDTAIPSNDKNRLEWDDIERSLEQWSKGERSDIQDILQSLMNNINRGIKEMSAESALKIRNQFNTH